MHFFKISMEKTHKTSGIEFLTLKPSLKIVIIIVEKIINHFKCL